MLFCLYPKSIHGMLVWALVRSYLNSASLKSETTRGRGHSLLNAAFRSAIHGLPRAAITRIAGRSLVAPCYHMVSDDSPIHTRHLYAERGIAEFEKDLDYLLQSFTPLSLEEIGSLSARGLSIPGNSLFLSFDDGFREMSEIVAPLCRRKGVPATFFLTTAFLDNRVLGSRHKASLLIDDCERQGIGADSPALKKLIQEAGLGPFESIRQTFLAVSHAQTHLLDECAVSLGVDFEDYLRTSRPYLTLDQVRGLLQEGFSIGGHSIDHPRYGDLEFNEQIRQTVECIQYLTGNFPVPCKAFAFPFVSDGVDDRFFEEVLTKNIADLVFCIGRMPTKSHKRAFQRFGVESPRPQQIEDLLTQQAEGALRKQLFSWKSKEACN